MRKIFFSLVFLFFFLTIINAQKNYVPDDKFEQALIDLGIDTDGIVNDSVLTSDISEYKNLDVHGKEIRDLTGIEGFKNLRTLKCSSNLLTSLDLGKKDSLINLYCRFNDLISLNVSECRSLKVIDADYNDLHNIDVSNNPDLEILNLSFGNRIGFFGNIIDVSNNLKLKRLDCQSNGLDTLDVRNNTALEQLYCSRNKLTSLDLSANTSLETLWVDGNQITNLDATNAAQKSALGAAKTKGFNDINTSATGRGMAFSGIPLDEQANYLAETYLPGMQRADAQTNADRLTLQGQAASLGTDQRKTALNLQQTQQSAANQWNLNAENNRFSASESAKSRSATAANRASDRAYAAELQAKADKEDEISPYEGTLAYIDDFIKSGAKMNSTVFQLARDKYTRVLKGDAGQFATDFWKYVPKEAQKDDGENGWRTYYYGS